MQVLSTRKRKDVSVGSIQVQVVLFAFDCLFLDGVSLLSRPLTARREALTASLMPKAGDMQFATFKVSPAKSYHVHSQHGLSGRQQPELQTQLCCLWLADCCAGG